MISKISTILLTSLFSIVFINFGFSQNDSEPSQDDIQRNYNFLNYRGLHGIDLAAGTAIVVVDNSTTEFAPYFRIGYKSHITRHLNVGLTFNKYNVVISDVYNEGFLSFDLNWEFVFSPSTKFSPYIFAGGGYNAANYFETTTTKAQGGLGLEFIITEGVGLKLFGEYNYILNEEMNGLVQGEANNTLLRMGLGLNIYFGGNKKKEALRRKLKTVINSNLIIPYN